MDTAEGTFDPEHEDEQERFERGGTRARKIGIVALARQLLIELWRFLEHGVIPEGAALKP